MPWLNIDGSWAMTLHEAWLRGWRFGSDIVFTYGPWGFLLTGQYHPKTYGIVVAAHLVLAVSMAASLSMRWTTAQSPYWRWIAAAIIAFLLFDAAARSPELLCLTMLWQLLFVTWRASRCGNLPAQEPQGPVRESESSGIARPFKSVSWEQVAFPAIAGAMSLTKFSLCLTAAVVVTICDLVGALRGQVVPLHWLCYAAWLVAFWLLAGQPLGLLPQFLAGSWEVALGYREMAIDGPILPIVAFLAASVYLLATCAVMLPDGRPRSAKRWAELTMLVAGGASLLWLLAKMGFTRHDKTHAAIALYGLAAIGLAAAGMILERVSTAKSLAIWLGIPITGAIAVLTIVAEPGFGESCTEVAFAPPTNYSSQFGSMFARLWIGDAALRNDYSATVQNLRQSSPAPELKGSVDLYPFQQGILLVNDLNYRPRPVFQSYSAYTESLARRNRDYLLGESAPDFVLFDIRPLDWREQRWDLGRFPSLEDGLSWPELLTRYDVDSDRSSDASLTHLVLARSRAPRPYSIEPIDKQQATFGQWIRVPAVESGPVWAELDMRFSDAGRAASLAWKPPAGRLDVRLSDGRELRFRLVLGAARSGFLLSPLIRSRYEFAWLGSTPWTRADWQKWLAAAAVDSIRVTSDGDWAYQSPINVAFHRLRFVAEENRAASFDARKAALLSMAVVSPARGYYSNLHLFPGYELVLGASPPSVFYLPIGDSRHSLISARTKRLCVQYDAVSFSPLGRGRPVPQLRFRVVTMSEDKHPLATLWQSTLAVAEQPRPRPVKAEFACDLGDASSVAFEVTGPPGISNVAALWFGVVGK
jgi:hypothetical protein